MIRNFFAGILMLAATLCTLVGSVLQWTDHTISTPEPTQQLVRTMARNDAVQGVVTDLLRSSIEERIPATVDQIPGLRARLKETIGTGVSTAMSSPEVQTIWESTLNDSRETLLKDLTEYGSGRSKTPPSVRVDLDPLVARVWETVRSTAGADASAAMDKVGVPTGIQVKVADIPQQQADQASQLLALASCWWLFHVAAGLLLAGALLLGTRIGRWVLLTVFAALGATVITAIRSSWTVVFPNPGGNQLIWILETETTNFLRSSLASSMDPLWFCFLALAAIGLVGAIGAGVRKNRG